MVGIAAETQEFRNSAIYDIGLVRGNINIADGLTKNMYQTQLQNVISTGALIIICEQWIIRSPQAVQNGKETNGREC